MCDVLDKVENRGIEKGIVKGESRGENKMALLVKCLSTSGLSMTQMIFRQKILTW